MSVKVVINGKNFYKDLADNLPKPVIKRRSWTPNEDNYLLDHWEHGDVNSICKHLNRSRSSCSTRASILGIYRQKHNNSVKGVYGRILENQRKLKNRNR